MIIEFTHISSVFIFSLLFCTPANWQGCLFPVYYIKTGHNAQDLLRFAMKRLYSEIQHVVQKKATHRPWRNQAELFLYQACKKPYKFSVGYRCGVPFIKGKSQAQWEDKWEGIRKAQKNCMRRWAFSHNRSNSSFRRQIPP